MRRHKLLPRQEGKRTSQRGLPGLPTQGDGGHRDPPHSGPVPIHHSTPLPPINPDPHLDIPPSEEGLPAGEGEVEEELSPQGNEGAAVEVGYDEEVQPQAAAEGGGSEAAGGSEDMRSPKG